MASSTIENTFTTPDELVRYQVSSAEPATAATKEVANYGMALEWGCSQLKERPIITLNLILGLHDLLLRGVRGNIAVGKFKNRQNFIGGTVESPIFTPPAPENVLELMSSYESYVNDASINEPKVIKCAYAHYQFETIHPFTDGNGRIGRVLIVLQMMQLGLISGPLIYPSVFFERTRSQYYEKLQAVRDAGKWVDWVTYFVDGMIFSSHKTIQLAQTIMTLQSDLRSQIEGARKKPSLRETLDCFFSYPVRTIRQISEQSGLAINSVSSALTDLCNIGMISELPDNFGKKRGRVYACTPILKTIFNAEMNEL